MTLPERLETAHQLLDEHRRLLDKEPLLDQAGLDQAGQLIQAIRLLIDDTCQALIPHVRHLRADQQARLLGGWTIYDPDLPGTWPLTNHQLVIRQYHSEPEQLSNPYRDQRRGRYEGGRLLWRSRGTRPLYRSLLDGDPVPDGWTYAWKEAD